MEIESLLFDSSKLTARHTADIAIKKTGLIKELVDIAFKDINQFSTRAANTIDIIDSQKPELIKIYYFNIINNLSKLKIEGVKRCLLKLLTRHAIPEDENMLCLLLNYCFDKLSAPNEAVAVKVYALDILYQISQKEPDIKNELVYVIQEQIPKNSAAFKNRANKILSKLKKLN